MSARIWLVVTIGVALGALLLVVARVKSRGARPVAVDSAGEFRATASSTRGPDPAAVFSDRLSLALAKAAVSGDLPGVAAALRAGAQVNARGTDGLTVLHLALLHFQAASFAALLERGADPNLPAENGDSVMSLVAVMPEPTWIELAIQHRGDVEMRDARDRTPLMLAARRERPANLRVLVAHGADVNARDKRSDTPLGHTFQALHPSTEIARELLHHGALADQPNAAGLTARDYAYSYGDRTLLAVFAEAR